MRSSAQVAFALVQRLKARGVAQVEGYNAFRFLRETESGVVVSREAGKDTPIAFARIVAAVEASRSDPAVYGGGPGALREYGVTHVNSPLWAILHLMTVEELTK